MKPRRSILYYFSIFTIAAIVVINADDEADYMSKFLKEVTSLPTSWSNNTHHCKWKGITCRSAVVIAISLPSSSLAGTFPDYINRLPNLTHIDISNNSFTGPMPCFAGLFALETVYLGNNNFTSTFSFCFALMYNLRTLNLRNNLNIYTWIFPMHLFDSTLLHTLDLQGTNLIGSIPSEIFERLPNLHTVVLSNNNLSGKLPLSLGNSRVRYLRLNNQGSYEKFSGDVDVIASMKFLTQAWLNNNSFDDRIPDLSNCTYLFDLKLHSNIFFGLIPPSLFALKSLKIITLNDNILQGPVPVFRKGVNATWEGNSFCRSNVGPCDPQVTILYEITEASKIPGGLADAEFGAKDNDVCTYGPSVGCRNGKIVSLDMRNRLLSGIISPAFSKLTSLVNLTLADNKLTGSIPYALTTLPQLRLLNISNNSLSGELPKFSSKVKLITRGNVLLDLHASASRDRNSTKTKTWKLVLIAVASIFSVGFVILVVIGIFLLVQRWISKRTNESIDHSMEDLIKKHAESLPSKSYTYAEVEIMTKSFREKLGEGGYGVVYKGTLPDGRQVAVKIRKESQDVSMEKGEDFMNEISCLSRTSHKHIISLLGFCFEKKRALIFEFMPQGSLEKHFMKSRSPNDVCRLGWYTMHEIAIGIAEGLDYLHDKCELKIVHLDIKPHNILLNEFFCPKITDFGQSKLCQKNNSIVSLSCPRGTAGFMPPEVLSPAYGVSSKSDVYSYGLLLLKMIEGRHVFGTGCSSTGVSTLIDKIYKYLERENNLENCSEISEVDADLVRKIIIVSMCCIQVEPIDRPSMKDVIQMLRSSLDNLTLPPKPCSREPQKPSLHTFYVSSNTVSETNPAITFS